ncbi:MAG: hypothetical protein O6761_02235 [Thaumarchaeota archaeon]|nr:hypothetical protein [Nitrososphaerota archaeon]
MHRFRIGTHRALSEIPTYTILLFAVVVLGIYLLSWSNTTLGAASTELTNSFDNKINRLAEEIIIEQVWFGTDVSSTKFVNVTLTNVSTIGISITEIELVNSTDTHIITITQNIFPDQTYSIVEEYVWTSGTVTDVTVTTARENVIKTQVSP